MQSYSTLQYLCCVMESDGNFSGAAVDNQSWVSISSLQGPRTEESADWSFMPIIKIIECLLVVFLNGCLLLAFIIDQKLLSPFKIYIVNLLAINLLFAALNAPLDVINSLYTIWRAGSAGCTLYMYTIYVLAGIQNHFHLLIAFTRLWAIIHPISYRHYHTTKTVVVLCVSVWCYIHLLILPGFIRDTMFFRLPVQTNPCFMNVAAQITWASAIQIWVFDMPIIWMMLAFAILIWFHSRFTTKLVPRRSVRNLVGPIVALTTATEGSGPSRTASVARVVVGASKVLTKSRSLVENTRAVRLVTFLTFSILVCWTPATLFFTVILWSERPLPLAWLEVGLILWSAQPFVDPLIFMWTFKDLRKAVKRILLR